MQRVGNFFSPEVRRSGREAGHSPLSSAEVKNEWGCTFAPPLCLRGVLIWTFALETGLGGLWTGLIWHRIWFSGCLL